MSTPNELAANKLTWEMNSWSSIEIRSHQRFDNHRSTPATNEVPGFTAAYRYVETADGKRLFEQTSEIQGQPDSVNIDYCDGKISAWLTRIHVQNVKREQVTIKHTFSDEDKGVTHRPEPLKYFYLGVEPLTTALAKASHLGSDNHLGRRCELFLFPRVKNGSVVLDFIYWLDAETSVPMRVEYYMDQTARDAKRPVAVWKATSFDSKDGHHLPFNCELERYAVDGAGPAKLLQKHVTVVDSVQFNNTYDSAMFWPAIGPQTSVVDLVKNRFSTPKSEMAATGTASPRDIIVANEGREAPSFATLTFTGGVAILVAACLMRWRKKV